MMAASSCALTYSAVSLAEFDYGSRLTACPWFIRALPARQNVRGAAPVTARNVA